MTRYLDPKELSKDLQHDAEMALVIDGKATISEHLESKLFKTSNQVLREALEINQNKRNKLLEDLEDGVGLKDRIQMANGANGVILPAGLVTWAGGLALTLANGGPKWGAGLLATAVAGYAVGTVAGGAFQFFKPAEKLAEEMNLRVESYDASAGWIQNTLEGRAALRAEKQAFQAWRQARNAKASAAGIASEGLQTVAVENQGAQPIGNGAGVDPSETLSIPLTDRLAQRALRRDQGMESSRPESRVEISTPKMT